MKCIYCESKEIREREIVRNKFALAFPTNIPIVPGHILICPIRCVARLSDLTREEIFAIFELTEKIRSALIKAFKAEGFNYAWNEGNLAGQTIPHFHLHILPRTDGDTGITKYEPRQFLYRPGSREPSPEKELIAIARLVQNQLL